MNYYEDSRIEKVSKLKKAMKAFQERPLRKKVDFDALETTNDNEIYTGTGYINSAPNFDL